MTRKKLLDFLKKNYLDNEKKLIGTKTSISNYDKKFEKELEAFLSLFFSIFSVNNEIDYATARRYVGKDELLEIRTMKEDLSWAGSTYKKYLQKITDKTRVSRIEYVQAKVTSYFEDMLTKSQDKIMKAFEDNARGDIADTTKFFNVELDITEKQLDNLSKEISRIKTQYGTPTAQIEAIRQSYYKMIETFIPQAFARKMTKEQILSELKDEASRIKKRLFAIVNTMGNYQYNYILEYVMDLLELQEYEYCAILDDRTSKICKELNGKVFKVSQARQGVNFPPMHPNCRSFIIPII